MADKAKVRVYRIIAPGKVGILPFPDVSATPASWFVTGDTFRVSRMFDGENTGRSYLKLTDGEGWIPECSRKDPLRKIVERADDIGKMALIDGEEEDANEASTADKKEAEASDSSSS